MNLSKQQTAVAAALAAGVPADQQRSVSCVADTSTPREVVVECFAPYNDHRWVNIVKFNKLVGIRSFKMNCFILERRRNGS